ncbi:hypothetical protein COLO4_09921 [Corchorus olitorius]|uniref:FLZ-type domain-containing protein n=1 Tax=Corchorus olitorius TaxID=93759 RepID=A0A1R3KAP6_9ROSI|nr:hypothetical protein COLO4_09921 [Corchorus olitorius]
MLLGKRSRHPIRRTTSMTGITVDVSNVEDEEAVVVQAPQPLIISDPYNNIQNPSFHEFPNPNHNFTGYDQSFLAMVSPRNHHHHVVDTAPFLRSCCLCKRRLAPGRDIYMYRGDAAFCSLECREKQMKQDERKEKLNVLASKKEDRTGHSSSKPNSSKTEPVAAA